MLLFDLFCENVLAVHPAELPNGASSRIAAKSCKLTLQSHSRKPRVSSVESEKLTNTNTPQFTFIFSTNPIVILIMCTFQHVLCIWTNLMTVCYSTERQVFLATWKDIPNDNESQFQIKDCHLNSGETPQRTEGD